MSHMQNAIVGAQFIIFSPKITAFMSESRWQERKTTCFFNNLIFINFFILLILKKTRVNVPFFFH